MKIDDYPANPATW